MDNHNWEIIIALSSTITAMAGWIVKYLLKELEEAKGALKKANEVNAQLAAMVPKLLEEARVNVDEKHGN